MVVVSKWSWFLGGRIIVFIFLLVFLSPGSAVRLSNILKKYFVLLLQEFITIRENVNRFYDLPEELVNASWWVWILRTVSEGDWGSCLWIVSDCRGWTLLMVDLVSALELILQYQFINDWLIKSVWNKLIIAFDFWS